MKSLAKIVAMGLVMSSVPVMGVWAENLVVTTRDQWDWKDPGYTYNAYSPIHHKNNDYEDVTIFMNGDEQEDTDNKFKPFNALINEYAQYHFSATGNVYIKDSCFSYKSTNAVYTYFGDDEHPNIDFRGAEKVVIIANALKDGYGSQAISAKKGGNIAIAAKETGYTKIIGDIDLYHRDGAGTVSVDLNNKDSYWYGNETNSNDEGKLNLSIRNGAEWIYTTGEKSLWGKSYTKGRYISKVTLKDGGIINLRNADVQKKFAEVNKDEALRSEDFGDLHMYDNGDHLVMCKSVA